MSLILRIFLAVAALMSAAAVVGGLKLKSSRNDLQTQVSVQQSKVTQLEGEASTFKKAADEAKSELQDVKSKRDQATTEAQQAKSDLEKQVSKVKEVQEKFDKTAAEATSLRADLDKYAKLLPAGKTADQLAAEIKDKEDKLTTAEQEKKVVQEQLTQAQAEIKKLQDAARPKVAGVMPKGTSGHVLAVNDEWNFVVLDIGANQGATAESVLLAYRDNALLGKVKIVSVEPSISIADVLPDAESKRPDIQEGDAVVY